VVFLDHFYHDRQRENKRHINAWSNVYSIAIAEYGELAANLPQEVAAIITDAKVPIPDVAVKLSYRMASCRIISWLVQIEEGRRSLFI
jgi:hypothetical protein